MDKQHILVEIRRTAAENSGRPLGARRFSTETGIVEADWLGKHWPRWADAVREAGLEPNTLQGAFDDDYLLEQYARSVRELGHMPVKAELQMRANRDSTFPNVSTFLRRFGNRRNIVLPLLAFCERSGQFDDVLAICRDFQAASAHATPPPSRHPERTVALGYVYLLKSGRHYKIGSTNAVGRRERELAIQLPQKAQVIHKIVTDDPTGIEAYWHTRFAAKRANGEWFTLSADDVAAFRRRKLM